MKPGTKVILKTQQYEDDKYNPRDLEGVVLNSDKLEVRWSNGIKNSYYANELEAISTRNENNSART